MFSGLSAFAQSDGYDVFIPITKYISQGNTDNLSAWFADNLEVSILTNANECSRNQAKQIVKTFFNSHTPRSFVINHTASRGNMKYALGNLNAGGEIYQTFTYFPLRQNGREIEAPWRVLPGRLSVSRTFGDIEAKDAKFGGIPGVVLALPDITEIELDDEYNFMVIGCDGIFDVLDNNEILECIKIVLKEKKVEEIVEDDVHELCGDFAAMIIKSAIAKDSSDNVSCIVVAFNLNGLLTLN